MKVNPLTEAAEAAFAGWDDRPIYDWAHDFVELSPPITKTGKFDLAESRHFVFPFEMLADEARRTVNVLKPVRGGGSLIGDVWLQWALSCDPGPFMNVFQSDPDAQSHFRDRIRKNLQNCIHTKFLLPRKFKWDEVPLANGYTLYTTGPSINSLQGKGVRYLRLDEPWTYDPGTINEALGRIGDYQKQRISKVLCISQAGPRQGINLHECQWYAQCKEAAWYEWEVECPACRRYYEPVFNGVREDGSFWGLVWDKIKAGNGDWNVAKCAPTVRFSCPHCRMDFSDGPAIKAHWNTSGRFRLAGDPNPTAATVHWETVIDFPWADLVDLWLRACNAFHHGDPGPKIQFYQKRRAIFMDLERLMKSGSSLTRVAYELNTTWPDEKHRFLTIDRQEEDVFWWTVRAHSETKTRRLGFGRAFSFQECEAVREEFKVAPNHTFCDSAYAPKGDHGVYAACARYNWLAVRGDKAYSFAHRVVKGHESRTVLRSYAPLTYGDPGYGITGGRRQCKLIRFSKPQMNEQVQQMIDAGDWEEPKAPDPEAEKKYHATETEYNEQMAARFRKVETNERTGEATVIWKETKDDHARDLANQQVLGRILTRLSRDPAMEQLTKTEQEKV